MPANREVWERIGVIERQLEVMALVKSGDKAAAAKLHRQETDTSLAEAVAVVEDLSG